jgi:hypothetical protein
MGYWDCLSDLLIVTSIMHHGQRAHERNLNPPQVAVTFGLRCHVADQHSIIKRSYNNASAHLSTWRGMVTLFTITLFAIQVTVLAVVVVCLPALTDDLVADFAYLSP